MSQVEFVAVMWVIFSKWIVEVVRREGVTAEAARERLVALVADSSLKLTVEMNRPQDAVLRFVKR